MFSLPITGMFANMVLYKFSIYGFYHSLLSYMKGLVICNDIALYEGISDM